MCISEQNDDTQYSYTWNSSFSEMQSLVDLSKEGSAEKDTYSCQEMQLCQSSMSNLSRPMDEIIGKEQAARQHAEIRKDVSGKLWLENLYSLVLCLYASYSSLQQENVSQEQNWKKVERNKMLDKAA